jgi:hypothetical protein
VAYVGVVDIHHLVLKSTTSGRGRGAKKLDGRSGLFGLSGLSGLSRLFGLSGRTRPTR